MEAYIRSVEESVRLANWYAAVVVALTLPDICGWLEHPNWRSEKRYVRWFRRYQLDAYTRPMPQGPATFLTGADCYALRCALLHEGSSKIMRQRAREVLERFVFATSGTHLGLIEDKLLFLDVERFCGTMCEGVRSWLSDMEGNTKVEKRMGELLAIQTEGAVVVPGVFIK